MRGARTERRMRNSLPPLTKAQPGTAADAHAGADKQAITEAIDGYLKSLTEPDIFDAPKPPGGAPPDAQTPVISHLNAVLRADGLAQELDAASPDARSGANGIWYVLSLKALESGGTLLKSGNAIIRHEDQLQRRSRGYLCALPFERRCHVLGRVLQL